MFVMYGHVLHRLREHLNVPGSSSVDKEPLTRELRRLLPRLNETSVSPLTSLLLTLYDNFNVSRSTSLLPTMYDKRSVSPLHQSVTPVLLYYYCTTV